VTLSPPCVDIAVRAARAIGADYAGVDLLPATDGTVYALEVNGIPGWQGVQKATGIDVADAIADHLLRSIGLR
jgi:glutathione synthase/RimK-type ligase-like ATP-grasp enzyme